MTNRNETRNYVERGAAMIGIGKRPDNRLMRTIALCAVLSGLGSLELRADLSRPDAVLYGSVSLNGQAVESGLVSARSGGVVLDSFALGSSTVPERFGLAIAISQATQGLGAAGGPSLNDGASAGIFLEDRLLTSVTVRSGVITLVDINAGQSQCNGGSNDGVQCSSDGDCPGGFCVASRAICNGGGDDGNSCECIGGSCSLAVACSQSAGMGTCEGGSAAGSCCDMALNCDGGTCSGTQRVCQGGAMKGQPCLRAEHCPGSQCVSTGVLCNGGSNAGYACVDNADCPSGTCGARIATPTHTPTRTPTPTRTINPTNGTSPTPTPTPTGGPSACAGDCDGMGSVSIAELIRLVNIALGRAPLANCAVGDVNGNGTITINELITAVNRALNGC